MQECEECTEVRDEGRYRIDGHETEDMYGMQEYKRYAVELIHFTD